MGSDGLDVTLERPAGGQDLKAMRSRQLVLQEMDRDDRGVTGEVASD